MALKKPLTGEITRTNLIREEIFGEPYSICLERPTLLDSYWRSGAARGKHPYTRRAEALAYIYKNRRPRIYNHELIFGNISSKRIAANYYPEGGSIHILEDIFCLGKRPVLPYHLERVEKWRLFTLGLRLFRESVAAKALFKPGWLGHFLNFFRAKRYYITEVAGISHLVPGHESVIKLGLEHFEKAAAGKLKETDGDPDKEAFYRGLGLVINGIRQMADNLAGQAELEAAKLPTDSERGRELLEGAEILRRVPYKPARTFREGLQAAWLIHLALNLEDFEQGISFGRLDQFLYPLYKKDLEKGLLTPDLARELLASFCLKCAETIPLYSRRINRFFGGNAVGQGITVGGVDTEGIDATNELSKLVLEAYSLVMTREPGLMVRVSGYCSYFCDLSPDVQDEIIERTAHGAGGQG